MWQLAIKNQREFKFGENRTLYINGGGERGELGRENGWRGGSRLRAMYINSAWNFMLHIGHQIWAVWFWCYRKQMWYMLQKAGVIHATESRCDTCYRKQVWYMLQKAGVIHVTESRCDTCYRKQVWYMLQKAGVIHVTESRCDTCYRKQVWCSKTSRSSCAGPAVICGTLIVASLLTTPGCTSSGTRETRCGCVRT